MFSSRNKKNIMWIPPLICSYAFWRAPSEDSYQRAHISMHISACTYQRAHQSAHISVQISECTYQSAHLCSLTRFCCPYAETLHPWLSKMHLVKILIRLHNVQSDLNLCWVHMFKGTVSDVVTYSGLLVAHFENIGFYTGSSSSKYRLFTGVLIKNIG